MVKLYKCETCNKEFKQKGHLTKHLNRKNPCEPDISASLRDEIEKLKEENKKLKSENMPDVIEKLNQEISDLQKECDDLKKNKLDTLFHHEIASLEKIIKPGSNLGKTLNVASLAIYADEKTRAACFLCKSLSSFSSSL